MILIENKLAIFEDIVYKSRLLKIEEEKEKILAEKQRLTEDKQKAIDQEIQQAVARRRNLATTIGNEEIAKAREEKRVLHLKKMGQLEDDLVEAVRQRAKEYVQDPIYEKALLEGIKESLAELDPGRYFLGLTQRDMDLYFDQGMALAKEKNIDLIPKVLEDKVIGGHVISDEKNTYNLKNDLNTMIEEKKYEIGMLLHNLFQEEAANE